MSQPPYGPPNQPQPWQQQPYGPPYGQVPPQQPYQQQPVPYQQPMPQPYQQPMQPQVVYYQQPAPYQAMHGQQVANQRMGGSTHTIHAVLTLFTCGLWAPVWIIVALLSRKKTVTRY